MPRSIDEIQHVSDPFVRIIHPDRSHFNSDAAFPLQIQLIQILRAHAPHFYRSGDLKEPVREGGFAMINMGDYHKVSNVIHFR